MHSTCRVGIRIHNVEVYYFINKKVLLSISIMLRCLLLVFIISSLSFSLGFLPSSSHHYDVVKLHAKRISNKERSEQKLKTKKKNRMTVQQIMEEVKKSSQQDHKKKYKRSRKRVESPKQTYVYAAQRRGLKNKGIIMNEIGDGEDGGDGAGLLDGDKNSTTTVRVTVDKNSPVMIARMLGMNPALQSCDASFAFRDDNKEMTPVEEPKILGEIKIGLGESQTGMHAYIIEKPQGWTILENKNKKSKKSPSIEKENTIAKDDDTDHRRSKKIKKFQLVDEATSSVDTWEIDLESLDLSQVMTAEELKEFKQEGGLETFNFVSGKPLKADSKSVGDTENQAPRKESITNDEHESPAVFLSESRPSVVTWLKRLKATEGVSIRGGNNWKAIAGATDIDDSGVVVLCPKESVNNIYIDSAQYFAVVGNGEYFAPKGKKDLKKLTVNDVKFEVYAKLRKGRGNDFITTSKITISDGSSTCNDAVHLCQNQYLDGVRGDPEGNPLERRANRRLVHCSTLTISSLTHDEVLECESNVTDDIRVYSERRNHHQFYKGSFLGREILRRDRHTTAYREINGAADGWPGWIVDRYGKWLFVQHDEIYPKGPLPSLHDGYTSGVYYFASDPDRSITGSVKGIKPILLEGQPAPDMIEIEENGIKYLVNFDELSTGIFLDQRLQRAWLARHCTEDTRVLNCFAHCGAFSVAAAMAGAKTTSMDLDKKWLDRIEPQLKANRIDAVIHHDRIYGDCFDWLTRLVKRGEKFDIVILDPPSTSVGSKKKRWSAKNDYHNLVKLAAPLVKKGGYLWTTTNSNQISSVKFARMCKKGLDEACVSNVKLERISTMPSDFPCVATQQVKNLVWKF